MKIKNICSFFIFLFIVLIFAVKVSATQKNIYFYFQDQFLIIYHDENEKLFVDIGSGFVIKPEDQKKKMKFVEYLLDTNSFISRDEDVFTKLYIFKKNINFDFNEVEPDNIDYYSWGPLTYKYLALFCKKISTSLTIRIPAFDQLPEETRRDIIERYRLVFGTSFNEPRYLPYDITITYQHSIQNIYSTQNVSEQLNTTVNSTVNFVSAQTTSLTNPTFDIFKHWENKKTVLWVYIVLGIIFIIPTLFLFKFLKNSKKEELYGDSNINTSTTVVDKEYSKKEEIMNLINEVENLKQKINLIEQNLEQFNFKVNQLEEKLEKILKVDKELEKIEENSIKEEYFSMEQDTKLLDKESLEMMMFKIDSLSNKIKLLEIYKDYDINIKASKIVSILYDLKGKIRKTKTVNFSEWDNFIKNNIIDLLSTLDKYLKKIGYNENIDKIKKEVMNDTEVEEIHIIPEQTKVNIMDHRVEGYAKNSLLPPGVIVEIKEEGYKYKGITIKRAKVIENRP